MIGKVAFALVAGFLAWCYREIKPPPPKLCGSPNGPPITSSRIRLRDGRHLAYKESGVPREKATFKIVVVHGLGDSRDFTIPASKELVEELGVCFVSYDRAGYGESDPNPSRSVTSEVWDIEQLADELGLGQRFHIIGASMGGYPVWACLKHIPHRLAGAALIVPVVNYWWPSFPSSLSSEAFRRQLVPDQWMFRIAHYSPSLLYGWLTQKWIPSSCIIAADPRVFSPHDKAILDLQGGHSERKLVGATAIQQGEFESIHRDLMVGFGTWEFDPMELQNPFPGQKESNVHIWQGYEDRLVPCSLQRFVAQRLPWIKYHEIPDAGHFVLMAPGVSDRVVRSLLLGDEASPTSE